MGQEVELKLLLGQNARAKLIAHPLLVDISSTQQELNNTYFDTPTQGLNKARCALRIRKQGKQYIQTLKTRGQSMAGLSHRGEWEWPVPNTQLQNEFLSDDIWPHHINRSELQAAFNTDFSRTTWLVVFQQSRIELVLDEGEVVAGDKRSLLNEVELELVDGIASDVFDLAMLLAQTVPLAIADINKAERGYRLFNGGNYAVDPFVINNDEGALLNAEMTQVLSSALNQAHRYLAVFECTADWRLVKLMMHKYQHISELLQSLKGESAAPSELLADIQWMIAGLNGVLIPAQLSYTLYADKSTNSKGLSQRLLKNLQAGMAVSLQALLADCRFGSTGLALGGFLLKLQQQSTPQTWRAHNQNICAKAYENYLVSGSLHDIRALYHGVLLQSDSAEWITLLRNQISSIEVALGMQLVEANIGLVQDPEDKAKTRSWARRITVVQRDIQQQLECIKQQQNIW
jgi:inorganic triphosphatase YgiF